MRWVLLISGHALLQPGLTDGIEAADDPVNQGHADVDRHIVGLGAANDFGLVKNLWDCNHGGQRGAFHHVQENIAKRGQGNPKGLGNDAPDQRGER